MPDWDDWKEKLPPEKPKEFVFMNPRSKNIPLFAEQPRISEYSLRTIRNALGEATPWRDIFDNIEVQAFVSRTWPACGRQSILVICLSEIMASAPASSTP